MYMPRVTLYVSDDLKALMDEVGEAENWSAVAQGAFREAVAVHAIKKEPDNMDHVIERLRASKERATQNSFNSGKVSGKNWAMERAEWEELKRVSECDEYTK